MAFSHTFKGLAVNHKIKVNDDNRIESHKLRKLESIASLKKAIIGYNIQLDGVKGSNLTLPERVVLLKKRRESLESLDKLLNPKPVTRVKRIKLINLSSGVNNSGDSVNNSPDIKDIGSRDVLKLTRNSVDNRSLMSSDSKKANIIKRGKVGKYKPKHKARHVNLKAIESQDIVEKVFNKRTDIVKPQEYSHLSNSEYIRKVNNPARIKELEAMVAQPEKSVPKKQGGNPNNAGNTNTIFKGEPKQRGLSFGF